VLVVILARLYTNLNFFKKYSNISFMKIRPVGADLLNVDGRRDRQTVTQKDMAKLIVAFRNVANAPKTENQLVTLRF
jgi:hypothetical protein